MPENYVETLNEGKGSMNYQNILCAGDSQTFGARTYGCYPIHMARFLSQETPYEWRVINLSANGYTARDLWFRLNSEIDQILNTYQACVLIGTNDVGNSTDIDLFKDYYRQILLTFAIKQFKAVFCGEIPPIFPDGHIFFSKKSEESRKLYNGAIQETAEEFDIAHLVKLDELCRDSYEDPVHFNEQGNICVARAFAGAILRY